MTTYRPPSCHLELPKFPSGVGFVFICPGRYEEKQGRPCAGQTGVMLEAALPLLFAKRPQIFPSPERDHYLITNAWPTVEYKGKTMRSVPLKSYIMLEQNIERLYHELKGLQYIVACGKLAHLVLDLCRQNFPLQAAVAQVSHTSRQALGCPTKADLPNRLDQWAESVVQQF